jgi:hypothetical protein
MDDKGFRRQFPKLTIMEHPTLLRHLPSISAEIAQSTVEQGEKSER